MAELSKIGLFQTFDYLTMSPTSIGRVPMINEPEILLSKFSTRIDP